MKATIADYKKAAERKSFNADRAEGQYYYKEKEEARVLAIEADKLNERVEAAWEKFTDYTGENGYGHSFNDYMKKNFIAGFLIATQSTEA